MVPIHCGYDVLSHKNHHSKHQYNLLFHQGNPTLLHSWSPVVQSSTSRMKRGIYQWCNWWLLSFFNIKYLVCEITVQNTQYITILGMNWKSETYIVKCIFLFLFIFKIKCDLFAWDNTSIFSIFVIACEKFVISRSFDPLLGILRKSFLTTCSFGGNELLLSHFHPVQQVSHLPKANFADIS